MDTTDSSQFDQMTEKEQEKFFRKLEMNLIKGDSSAVTANLTAERSVVYRDARFPDPDQFIRHHPNGRIELIKINDDLQQVVFRVLSE